MRFLELPATSCPPSILCCLVFRLWSGGVCDTCRLYVMALSRVRTKVLRAGTFCPF